MAKILLTVTSENHYLHVFFFQYKGTLLHFQTIPKWGMRTRKEIFTILVSNTLAKTDL